MTDPFELMRNAASNADVLRAAAVLTKFDLDRLAAERPENEIHVFGEYVFAHCQATGVQRALIVGGLLEIFAAVSREEKYPELLDEMYQRLGIKRSLAYELRAVWRRFGKPLTEDKLIAKQFVAEALKILARESTPPAATAEAIELARGGQFVDIAVATKLRAKHRSNDHDEANTVAKDTESEPKRSAKRIKLVAGGLWSFTGTFVKVVLKPTGGGKRADFAAMIEDLKEAIKVLEQRHRHAVREETYV